MNKREKQDFYNNANTVKQYEELRFSNTGGQFVHNLEEQSFKQCLEQCENVESILDIPCGTGRMFSLIVAKDFHVTHAADYSNEMLKVCQVSSLSKSVKLSKQDIYSTTFPSQTFSVILSSRFLFHSDDQDRLFSEFERLLTRQGYLIFDGLRWSPRTWTRLFSQTLGGNIYTNSDKSIYELASSHGFEVVKSKSILMLPSFLYNFVPSFLMRPLEWFESIWPSQLKTKTVWVLRKV